MTPLKTKITAAEDRIKKNPCREQGNTELDRKELVDARIETVINHFSLFEDFIIPIVDAEHTHLAKLEARIKALEMDDKPRRKAE